MHPLVERIVGLRKIEDPETFLHPAYDDRPDPFLMKGMDIAVSRILSALEKGEKICVWHDYDCDGIPGGALLFDFFRRIRYAPSHAMAGPRMYVPERSEGYGLNEAGIRKLKEEGVSLIVTVDCGITDIAEAAFAGELGIDVIITDHHLPLPAQAGQAELPPAIAILDAHRADDTYPFKGLCGTGVAFKLVEALIKKGNFDIVPGSEKWLLDLVALATVADMVPLTGENRTLVKYGLTVMRKGRRPGLKAIFDLDRVPVDAVTEDDLAFSVAPKVNASSRMSTPTIAFELLTTESSRRAEELAAKLLSLNTERKTEGMRVAKDVKKKIDGMPALSSIIVMGSREWRPSLLGIAATSVVETYHRTVCLWGADPSTGSGQAGLIKGSCRSDGTVNIVTLMTEAKDAFLDFGGHEFSGGFSVSPDAVHELSEKLESAFVSLNGKPACAGRLALAEEGLPAQAGLPAAIGAEPEEMEGTLTLAEANAEAFDALRELAPFGQGNPKPVFRFMNVSVAAINRFGKAQEHARLTLADGSGRERDAIAFFVSRQPFRDALDLLSPGDRVTVDAAIERSYFRGRKELRLRIEDIRPVSG